MGPVFAALITAAGIAQVSAIAQTKFGDTNASAGTAGSGSAPSNIIGQSTQFVSQPPSASASEGGGPTIIFTGNNFNANNIDELIDKIGDKINQGDHVMIQSTSRQAREIQNA